MPVYEYQCPTCGIRFERKQSFSDKPLEVCPEGHQGVKRVFTPAPVVFKGSGWYITDSRSSATPNGKNGKSAAEGDSSETKTGAPSETKSEAKSETKSETKSDAKADTKVEAKSES